jgi:hypothetical protein
MHFLGGYFEATNVRIIVCLFHKNEINDNEKKNMTENSINKNFT